MNNLVIGIQSRISSSRLPGKSLLKLEDTTVLGMCIKRALETGLPVYLLTSEKEEDNLIALEGENAGVNGVIRGSLKNVLGRFLSLSKIVETNHIVRVTADNPLTEFRFIYDLNDLLSKNKFKYVSMNNSICPEGTNLEIFTKEALYESFRSDNSPENLEHVTYYMKKISSNKQFLLKNKLGYKNNEYEKISFTIDNLEDYINVANIIKKVRQEYKCEYYSKDFVRLIVHYIKSKGGVFLKKRNHPL